ncbi:MAG: hypothetical protein AB1403_16325, partial [Candidatus Riflebacteria bacterium]
GAGMKIDSLRIVFLLTAFLLVGIGCGASESFIDSIYEAGGLSGQAIASTSSPLDSAGSFKKTHEYQPELENQLIDDIHRLMQTVKSVKVIDLQRFNSVASGNLSQATIKKFGIVKIRTKTVSRVTSRASSTRIIILNIPGVKTITGKIVVVTIPTEQPARITDSEQSLVARLKKMGFEIEGGLKREGGLWNSSQLFYLIKALQSLPAHFIKCTRQFKRVISFGSRKGVMGYVFAGQPRVHICDWGARPVKFEETLVHEMAHVWMFDKANSREKALYLKQFWPDNRQPAQNKEQPTSVYGYSNVYEDFAEAVRYYWQDGPAMQKSHPQRWAFIKKYVFKGTYYKTRQAISSAASKSLID